MKSVRLALGSGGARGWAHIGVIRALQEAGIRIAGISGASIGALVGAIHCAGELDELEVFIREMHWRDMLSYFDMVFPTTGLLDGDRVHALLSEHLQGMRIEDSPVPFCCVATDLLKGEEVHLTSGPMVDAVRASIAVPGIFTPFCRGERFLGDGGIVNPVPVDVVRGMGAGVVVAVNLNRNDVGDGPEAPSEPASMKGEDFRGEGESGEDRENERATGTSPEATGHSPSSLLTTIGDQYQNLRQDIREKVDRWFPDGDPGPNIFDVIGTSLHVMEQQVTQRRLEAHPPDILVEPPLSDFTIFDFHRSSRIIRIGHSAMKRQLPALLELL